MRKLLPNSIVLFSAMCVSIGYAQTEPPAQPSIPPAAVDSELEGLLPAEPVLEAPVQDEPVQDEPVQDEPVLDEPAVDTVEVAPEIQNEEVAPPTIPEEEIAPIESGDILESHIEGEVIQGEVIQGEVIQGDVIQGEIVHGNVVEGEIVESGIVSGLSHGASNSGVVAKSYANGPHFGHGQLIHNAPSYAAAAIQNSMNYATATPYTFYDPYYYGWHGNFYPASRLQFRGWSIWRRWTNLYPTGGLAFYPSHYQAHFARYPRDYFYPYYYHPSYTGHVNVVPVMYRYPHVPIIYTKPYVPLFGANQSNGNATEQQFDENNLPVELTAENIAQMSIRMGEGETLRFVSLQDEQSEAISSKPARSSFNKEQATELYGMGYHEFYRGNHEEALAYFAEAIDSIEDDARVWYYKGLSEAALGNDGAAVRSLGQAVRLHIDHPEQNSAVSKALSRVQGSFRVQLLEAKRAAQSELLTRKASDLQG